MTRNATSFVGSKEIHFVSPIFIWLSSILVWEYYECFCTHFPFEKVHACKFGEDKIKPQILKQKRDNYWYRILSDLDQYAKNANLNPKMLEIMFSKKKKKTNLFYPNQIYEQIILVIQEPKIPSLPFLAKVD